MAETVATFDVIIAGGGLVGRSLALALAGLAPDGFQRRARRCRADKPCR